MKVDLGVYSKNKEFPKVYGPRRRVDRKVLTQRSIQTGTENKKSGAKKAFLMVFLLLVFTLIGGAVWKFNNYQARVNYDGSDVEGEKVKVCDNILNPDCWTDVFKPTFKKTNDYTNALLLGVDSRSTGTESALKNTDSIIIASINHKDKKAMLISIPRDMIINVKHNGKFCTTTRVNAIYAMNGSCNTTSGMDLLIENLEEYLGIDIHYNAIVDFEAVKGVVDAVGGVEVDVPLNITVTYPDAEPPFAVRRYTFKKGKQTMDGKTALRWARFRKAYSGDKGYLAYASDFSRARRQQQVIDAIKSKVLADDSGNLTSKSQKYWKIYQSLSSHIKVNEISPEDGLAAFSLMSEYDIDPINLVLDPNFLGLNQVIKTGDQSTIGGYNIVANDPTWGEIRTAIKEIWKYPGVYDDQATVVLSNGTSGSMNSKATQLTNADIPFGHLYVASTPKTTKTGITIYDFSGGKKSRTIEFLKSYFGTTKVVTEPGAQGVKQTGYVEDIKVVFGPAEPTPTPGTQQ